MTTVQSTTGELSKTRLDSVAMAELKKKLKKLEKPSSQQQQPQASKSFAPFKAPTAHRQPTALFPCTRR